jgi:hypothetical protein
VAAGVVIARVEADGREHAAQGVALVHGNDGEQVGIGGNVIQRSRSDFRGVCHVMSFLGRLPDEVGERQSLAVESERGQQGGSGDARLYHR